VTRVRGLVFILVTSSRDIRDGNPRAYLLSHNSSVAVRRDPIVCTRAERRQDGLACRRPEGLTAALDEKQ
jgi:hypothetical protein